MVDIGIMGFFVNLCIQFLCDINFIVNDKCKCVFVLMWLENKMLFGNLIIVIVCLLEQKKMNGMKFIKYMC